MAITRAAIVLFVATVVLGPLYTVPGYSSTSNVISELAAQSTRGNYLMSVAFVLLGVCVAIDGLTSRHRSLAPLVAFGLCFAAAGIFGHKPITAGVPYSAWQDKLHSILATFSGIALTVGFVWQALLATTRSYRAIVVALASLCVGLPMLMLVLPNYQGAVQRVMYLLVFAWLWAYYPRVAMPNISLQRDRDG
jgi:hypothetical membrane protein